jgi:putative protein-disulfide isomerase
MTHVYYVHDPMCSWCYAFAPTWERIAAAIPPGFDVALLVGGLAPDSDAPMPADMRVRIEQTWRRIQTVVPGTEFNYEFWTRNTPRRSTYPACRAVLAAKHFDPALEAPMIAAIQRAYYRDARNPSDIETLSALAAELGIERAAFEDWCASDACAGALQHDLGKTRALGVSGFPTLVLATAGGVWRLPHAFGEPDVTLTALKSVQPD